LIGGVALDFAADCVRLLALKVQALQRSYFVAP
jgi:hypothetical protein